MTVGLEERPLVVGFDERRTDGVHGPVVNVRFQFDRCHVDANEVIVSVPTVRFELLDEHRGLDACTVAHAPT